MEHKLAPAFFWPFNSTTVRSVRRSVATPLQRLLIRAVWRLAPRHATERAVSAMLTPPAHAFPDEELLLMEYASQVRVALGRRHLVGWRWGRRRDPVVLVVHGWGGRGTQFRHFVAPLRAAGFAVVSFDAPGHGMSGDGVSSLHEFVRALDAMLDHLGPVHALVGHSMGAAAAALVMARRSHEVGRGVLIAPPASLEQSTRRIANALGWPGGMQEAVLGAIERQVGVPIGLFEAARHVGPQPLLLIHDRQDREVPFADGMRYVQTWPGARLLATEGLGHRRILAAPAVLDATADFLAGSRP
jgi:pimeloyl-ACP methyl ester carboxylesterase